MWQHLVKRIQYDWRNQKSMCFNTVRVVLGTTIVTLSALYFVVLVEPENQMVTVSRKVRFNVMKAWLDKSNQTQMERKEHIQKVCQKYGFKEAHTWAYLSTISPIYTQNLIPKVSMFSSAEAYNWNHHIEKHPGISKNGQSFCSCLLQSQGGFKQLDGIVCQTAGPTTMGQTESNSPILLVWCSVMCIN